MPTVRRPRVGTSGLISLTYVSEVTIPLENVACEIGAIVDRARSFNADNHVTGALMFTGSRFTQTLEGQPSVVEALLRQIEKDSRHTNVQVIDRRVVARRAFSGWAMAYAGPSVFVSRLLDLVLAPDQPRSVDRLINLIAEFARRPKSF